MGCTTGCLLSTAAVAPSRFCWTATVAPSRFCWTATGAPLRFCWTATAWQQAHQDFQWHIGDTALPQSFEALLRHVDARAGAGAGAVPLSRLFRSRRRFPCTPRVREFLRQVRVLESERALLYKALENVNNARYSCRARLGRCSATFDEFLGVQGKPGNLRRVIEGAIRLAEVELDKLGFAFAVEMQSRRCG